MLLLVLELVRVQTSKQEKGEVPLIIWCGVWGVGRASMDKRGKIESVDITSK